ncbi:MAG: tRNA (guanosine(46)-N7)-methyltransferase TrmB [Bacteroidales bacterium]|nr:tRNA (guanosine(46)-N7)-methyltransferase TrmB [Bacteroidales bacterium]
MSKNKLQKFAENATFPHLIQPTKEEMFRGFPLKNRWNHDFFQVDQPITLELGCGKGEYTVGLAQSYPERNFIGVDRKGARMWRGARTTLDNKLTNAGFLRIPIDFIDLCFGENEVDEIWMTFPDPQPKKRQIKRRLTSPGFLEKYRRILRPGGLIHLKTDNTLIFDYTIETLRQLGHRLYFYTHDLYGSEKGGDASGIKTHYESMFLAEGKKIAYLCFSFNDTKAHERQRNSLSHPEYEPSFFERVYQVVRMVPYGRVTSYGAIATFLGSGQSARMVGWAMNASHTSAASVPAHRVVNRNGMLTGKHHFGGPSVMEQLLENEGIRVKEDRITDFKRLFWDPAREITGDPPAPEG